MGDITVEYLQKYSRAISTANKTAAATKQIPASLPVITSNHFFTDEFLMSLNPAEAITRFEDKEPGYYEFTKNAFLFLRKELNLASDKQRWCTVLKVFHAKLMLHTEVKHSAHNTTDFELVPGKASDAIGLTALFEQCNDLSNCLSLEICYKSNENGEYDKYVFIHPTVLNRVSESQRGMSLVLPETDSAIFLNANFEEGPSLLVSKLINDFINQKNPTGDISANKIRIKLVSFKEKKQRLGELDIILVNLLRALQSLDQGDEQLNQQVIAIMAHHMQRLLQLHPFADGNTRFAYLLTNVILEKFGQEPSFFPYFMSIFDANSPERVIALIIQGQQLFKTYFKVGSLQALFSYDIAEKEKASIVLAHQAFLKEQRNSKSTSGSDDIVERYTQLIQCALSSWQHSAHKNAFALLILKCMRNRVMLCPKPQKADSSSSAIAYGKAFHRFYQHNKLTNVPKIQAYYDQRKTQIPR